MRILRQAARLATAAAVAAVLAATAGTLAVRAQNAAPRASPPGPSVEDLVSAVVRIKTFINPDGRSVQNLGREREGSGIVIDESGLVLTIGYLMVEAHAAEAITNDGRKIPAAVVGYDHLCRDPETRDGALRLPDTGLQGLGFVEAGEHDAQRQGARSGRRVGAGDGRRRGETGHVKGELVIR